MTKVEVEANELRNGKIEKISLVTHGAIRQPFKILKTREIAEETKPAGLGDKLSKIFGATEKSDKKVAAVFLRKEVARKWLPLIKKHGFRAEKDHSSLEGDILVLKQEGFDENSDGSVVALNQDVAIQLSHVSKYFDAWPASSSFEENVAAESFWPGVRSATESLSETVWQVLNNSDDPTEAATEVGKQVKAFSTHLVNLINELPTTVFKMEQESLTKEFASSNVSVSNKQKIVPDEEESMSTVIKEVAAGDLDGLLDDAPAADAAIQKAEAGADLDDEVAKGDEGAPATGGSPGSPVVDSTTDTGTVSLDEGGVPEGFRKEERVLKQLEDGKVIEKFAEFLINDETKEEIFVGFITKDEDTDEAPAHDYSPAEVKLFEAMGVMVKAVTELKETVVKQDEKIAAISKAANTAIQKAEDTVVMSIADDLDESLATLSGRATTKKEEAATVVKDVFAGLLPQIERPAA